MSPVYFYFFNMASRKFKIRPMNHIVFQLDSADLCVISTNSHSNPVK